MIREEVFQQLRSTSSLRILLLMFLKRIDRDSQAFGVLFFSFAKGNDKHSTVS